MPRSQRTQGEVRESGRMVYGSSRLILSTVAQMTRRKRRKKTLPKERRGYPGWVGAQGKKTGRAGPQGRVGREAGRVHFENQDPYLFLQSASEMGQGSSNLPLSG